MSSLGVSERYSEHIDGLVGSQNRMKPSGYRIWNSTIIASVFIVTCQTQLFHNNIMLKSCLSFTSKTTTTIATRRNVPSQPFFQTILEATSSSRRTNYKSRNYTNSRKFSLADNPSASMPKRKKGPKFYAVAVGRNTGIYSTWDECQSQVKGFSNARFKSFSTVEEAESFIASSSNTNSNRNIETDTFSRIAASTKTKRPRVPASKAPEASKLKSAKNPIKLEATANAGDVDNNTNDGESSEKHVTNKRQPHKLHFHVMFDGGSRGNPHGDAGSGTHILTRKFFSETEKKAKTEITRKTDNIRTYLGSGKLTNNQAEYTGLVTGLKKVFGDLKKVGVSQEVIVFVQGDSDLIIKQMNGIYECKSPKLKPYNHEAKELVGAILKRCKAMGSKCQITFEHVYRTDNKIADGLANEAMDAKRSWTTSKGGDNDSDDAIEV